MFTKSQPQYKENKGKLTMNTAQSLQSIFYIMQGNRLHAVDTEGNYRVLGNTVWKDTASMTSIGNTRAFCKSAESPQKTIEGRKILISLFGTYIHS